MHIFLVRHGESLGNLDPSAYAKHGDRNIPLTLWGEQQAHAAGKDIVAYLTEHPELRNKKVKILHSTYDRAADTAKAIINALGEERVTSITPVEGLREQDMGVARSFMYEDIPFDPSHEEHRSKFENYVADSKNDKYSAQPPSGESGEDIARRVQPTIDKLKKSQTDDAVIVIVAHKATNRVLEKILLGKDAAWYATAPGGNNCDVKLFEGDFDSGFSVKPVHEGIKRDVPIESRYARKKFGAGVELI